LDHSREKESREAEELVNTQSLQLSQYEQDFARAQATITKLELEIEVAHRAQYLLEDQKQDNVSLVSRRIELPG
jgi:hypothetical protein